MGTKTFYYKVASFIPHAGNHTLQDFLRIAYEHAPKPHQRKQVIKSPTGEDSKGRNVVALRLEHLDMSCGILQHYKEGAPVLASLHSEDDDNFSMVQMPPPIQADAKKKAEFVKHLLYFAVRGNHVAFIQSRGIGSAELEDHLGWLISRFGSDSRSAGPPKLYLEDNVPIGYRDQKLKGVKSIVLYSEPDVRAIIPTDGEPPVTGGSKAIAIQQMWALNDDPLIEGFLALLRKRKPDAARDQIFKLEDAFKKGALRAKVVLEFADGGVSEGSPLDSAAHILRHVDGLRYDMTLPHMEPLKSVDSKISRKYHVNVREELINPASAFDKMAAMLDDLVKSKDILPDP